MAKTLSVLTAALLFIAFVEFMTAFLLFAVRG